MSALDTQDLEHVLHLLEGAEARQSPTELRHATLEGLAREFDYRRTTFFLTGPPVPGTAGTDGVMHGFEPAVMSEYLDRFSADDVFRAGPAAQLLRRDGVASLAQLHGRIDGRGRNYVEQFLVRHRIGAQLTLWLDTGLPVHGIVCVLGRADDTFTERDRSVLLSLRPHLSNLLADQLRRGPEAGSLERLSVRERDVVRLVAAGFTNREIAATLCLSEDTVKKHISRAMARTGLRNRTELALAFSRA